MKQGYRFIIQDQETLSETHYDLINKDINVIVNEHREKIQDFAKVFSIELTQQLANNSVSQSSKIQDAFDFFDNILSRNTNIALKIEFYQAESIKEVNENTQFIAESEILDEDLFNSEFHMYDLTTEFIPIEGLNRRLIPTTLFLTDSLVIVLKKE